MADIVSPEVRSRMMAGIRGKNTKPELLIRSGLHKLGYRFKLHDRALPGKPDLVLPKWNAVVFVHGCFWHGHGCHLFRLPSTRKEFWLDKIERNRRSDESAVRALLDMGWRVAVIWECSTKGKTKLPIGSILANLVNWLQSSRLRIEIDGLGGG